MRDVQQPDLAKGGSTPPPETALVHTGGDLAVYDTFWARKALRGRPPLQVAAQGATV
jgi:hypothetical protein